MNTHFPGENFGYVPDEEMPEAAELFDALLSDYPHDDFDIPPVVSFASYRPTLVRLAERYDTLREAGQRFWWWEFARTLLLAPAQADLSRAIPFDSNQGNLGSCAGFSEANMAMCDVLTQIGLGAELVFEPINPFYMWTISKGGSTRGGQSMSAVLTYGNEVGNFPVSAVGKYSAGLRGVRDLPEHRDAAARHQIGASRLPGQGEELAENILLCLRALKSVCIGNSVAVKGSTVGVDGLKTVSLGGSWMHATGFSGYRRHGGEEFAFWVNSHGNARYASGPENEPGCGGWMRRRDLVRFCSGRYADAFVLTYAEAGHGPVRTDLNPPDVRDR